jgi:methionine synthase I (cobalamin-dependent)/5,10-methylenetetrahydrofolate reductase
MVPGMATPSSLLRKVESTPVLADGAMATMLHARGIPIDHCFEELNLSQRAIVGEIHRAHLEAGAEIIFTNTFGANRFRLARHGLEARVGDINSAGVSLAREAVEATGGSAYVAGDVGPLGAHLAPFGRMGAADAEAAFREQIEALAAGGVDLLVIETMSDVREAALAARAAKAITGLPVIVSVTFTRDDLTLLGDSPPAIARELAALGADFIGLNCSSGPAQAMRLLAQLRQAAPDARLMVKPNAGWPEQIGGRIMYPATPEYFAGCAVSFADAGASIIGGCCGTTPQHIAAMRRALDARPRTRTTAAVRPLTVAAHDRGASASEPTRLARMLTAGKFLIGVEMDPPRGLNTQRLLAGARALAEAGADVINVADSPMARMRMSPWAVCHLIQDQVGIETVLHFPIRGRNLLRLQGDLLAAHALGIRNVFVVLGDPTALGDHPSAADNYDIVPSGLIRLMKQGLNAGVSHAGTGIEQPTAFVTGCAVNPCAADVDKEAKTLHCKIEAGADFALTQPIFEVVRARRFIATYEQRYGPLELPLLVGVLPLYSARHAAFLHNEVPGITIPDVLQSRMSNGSGPEEGVRIARELLLELKEVAQGAYLMPPFGRYELAAEIIDGVRSSAP